MLQAALSNLSCTGSTPCQPKNSMFCVGQKIPQSCLSYASTPAAWLCLCLAEYLITSAPSRITRFFFSFFFLLNNSSLSQILIVFLSLKTHIFRCVATYPHTKTLVSFPCTSELTRGQSLRRTVVGWSVIITDYVRVTRKTQRTRHYS